MANRSWLMLVLDINALDANESALRTHLLAAGDTVTPLLHTAAVPANYATYSGVIFGTSMQSNQTQKWDNTPIPVFSMQLGRFIHTQQASVTSSSGGDSRTTRYVETTVATNGPVGLVTVYGAAPSSAYDWILDTNLAPNVVIYSRHQAAGDRITGILIPAGTTLLNAAVSPNKNRATTHTDDYVNLNTDGWAIIDDVLEWVAPSSVPSGVQSNRYMVIGGALVPVNTYMVQNGVLV